MNTVILQELNIYDDPYHTHNIVAEIFKVILGAGVVILGVLCQRWIEKCKETKNNRYLLRLYNEHLLGVFKSLQKIYGSYTTFVTAVRLTPFSDVLMTTTFNSPDLKNIVNIDKRDLYKGFIEIYDGVTNQAVNDYNICINHLYNLEEVTVRVNERIQSLIEEITPDLRKYQTKITNLKRNVTETIKYDFNSIEFDELEKLTEINENYEKALNDALRTDNKTLDFDYDNYLKLLHRTLRDTNPLNSFYQSVLSDCTDLMGTRNKIKFAVSLNRIKVDRDIFYIRSTLELLNTNTISIDTALNTQTKLIKPYKTN